MPPVFRQLSGHAKLLLLFVWSNAKILAAPASPRPDMRMALIRARQMWRFFGFEPDVEGFASWVARILASEPGRPADAAIEPPPGARERLTLAAPAPGAFKASKVGASREIRHTPA